ncbi:MAG: tRNA (adenosine(37)-N6)-threonylcarbamoyltransferase complex ATPase subunit type 1 TsaE [Candidatus Eisenbacteria sp.]|nr:tRNA (adenosine(37)-N6)-threonylcarbamoyltransferase complex ATPase subunit type 1 TsaE [Candidatus Eisenbacteria bacterium]
MGAALALNLQGGDVVGLSGDLGSGKTCLARGICRGLGVEDRVTSPSFLTVNEYRGRLRVFHIDLYRVGRVTDLRTDGYDEMIFGSGVALIEWSEKIAGVLPEDRLDISIEITGRQSRRLIFRPGGARGKDLLSRFTEGWANQ